ncbi:MAG: signal peptidase I [Gammaproteobacteria bacterium]|nr:signal peptidase I [Gammaproteobacteria bacterium]
MDIDFPLVLTWAVLISGGIWLFDALFLKARRLEARSAEEADAPDKEPMIVEYARSFFPVLLLVLVLRSFLAEPYQIPSESMVPTLEVGDFILVNKYAYGIRLPVLGTKIVEIGEPQRGDIMVFIPPHDSRYFIKRVIGLPGDRIRYQDKALYVNDERAEYEFVREFYDVIGGAAVPVRAYRESLGEGTHTTYRYPVGDRNGEWTVPEDSYFVMGDNRDRSDDSRRWKYVSEAKIVGKAVAIWVHKDPGFKLPTFERNQWLTRTAAQPDSRPSGLIQAEAALIRD